MNELTTFYGQIAEQGEARDKARAVYALCRFITPQFYSKQTRDEAAATVSSIQVLTADIDGAVMAKMCEMAAKDYPKARSENPKVFFDINYILTFYKKAAENLRTEAPSILQKTQNIQKQAFPASRLCLIQKAAVIQFLQTWFLTIQATLVTRQKSEG